MQGAVSAEGDDVAFPFAAEFGGKGGGVARFFRLIEAHLFAPLGKARQGALQQLFLFPFPRLRVGDDVVHFSLLCRLKRRGLLYLSGAFCGGVFLFLPPAAARVFKSPARSGFPFQKIK